LAKHGQFEIARRFVARLKARKLGHRLVNANGRVDCIEQAVDLFVIDKGAIVI